MSEEPIRAGIIGLGRSGWNIHANALSEHPGFEMAAVADPVAERQEEAVQRFSCKAYREPDGLLADSDVELVVIATPSYTHAPLATAALRSNKHVVVEKPMAQNLSEMDEMLAAAGSTDRILTCYQPLRLDAGFVAIQEVIASGRLGRIVMIRQSSHGFSRRADWQTLRKYGGGELVNNGPHSIDQMLLLLGDGPIELFADLQHTVSVGDAEDHVKLCLKNRTDTVGEIEISSCIAFPQPEWLVAGTSGGICGSGNDLKVRWFDPDKLGAIELNEGPAPERKYGTGERIEWQEETLRPEQKRSPALLYYDRLRNTLREDAPLFVTPESIRRQIEIIERAREQTGFK